MTVILDTRQFELPSLRHLAACFSPPGLRLVSKVPGAAHTSSIVVRGAAGIGKTTFALTLADDIARETGGWVGWLSSEAGLTDLVAKNLALEHPREVKDWSSFAAADASSVLTDPDLAAEAAAVDTAAEKRTATLEGVWKRIDAVKEAAQLGQAKFPSVLVIDAFGLLLPGEQSLDFREQVVDLVRFCEMNGVTTIFVEEANDDSSDVLSFACDVVFQLEWSKHAAGGRVRRLAIEKARYSESLAGPHEFGFENVGQTRRLAVWPEVAAAVAFDPGLRRAPVRLDARAYGMKELPSAPYDVRVNCFNHAFPNNFWGTHLAQAGDTCFVVDLGASPVIGIKAFPHPTTELFRSTNAHALLWHALSSTRTGGRAGDAGSLIVRDPQKADRRAPFIEELVTGARALGLGVVGLEGPFAAED